MIAHRRLVPSRLTPKLGRPAGRANRLTNPTRRTIGGCAARQRLLEAGQTAEAARLAADRHRPRAGDPGRVRRHRCVHLDRGDESRDSHAGAIDLGTRWASPMRTSTLAWRATAPTSSPRPQIFTYTGPLHNQIPRPLSASRSLRRHRSGPRTSARSWFNDFHVRQRRDVQLHPHRRLAGERGLYRPVGQATTSATCPAAVYTVTGDVIGWLPAAALDLVVWRRSSAPARARPTTAARESDGGIPGAGNYRDAGQGCPGCGQRHQQHHPRL